MNQYEEEGSKWISVLKKERVRAWLLVLSGMAMCVCVFIGESVDEAHKWLWIGVGFAIVIPPFIEAWVYLKRKGDLW